jgi:SAM-dependent methyltransferase
MANAAQAERWNGESGQRWIANRERHQAVRQRVTPHLLRAAGLGSGEHVLDIGCGCGETTLAAAAAVGPDGSALGLDLSGTMLAVARRLAAEAGVANARFVEGDAQVYPLPPAGHDVAISSFGVMFFDDPAAAFGNVRSALRPGGRLAFLCWQPEEHNELFAIPRRAVGAPAEDDDPFGDPEWVSGLLAGAGFADVRVGAVREPARIGADVPDVMSYALGMAKVRELMAGVQDRQTVLAAMEQQYAAHQRADGVWVDAAAWLVTARVPLSGI